MAATANWRCADCDTYNAPARKTCSICSSTRRAPAPTPAGAPPRKSPPRPTAKRPSSARPTADWRCTKCDTNNHKSDTSCIVCGTGWRAGTKPAARPAAKKSPPKAAKPASGGVAKPVPKKKTTSSSSSTRTTASKRPAPKRPSSTGSIRSTSSTRHESLFHPPPTSTTGYTPTAPRPTPPRPTAPVSGWSPPPAPPKRNDGWATCLGVIVIGILLLVIGKGCIAALDTHSSTPDDTDTSPSTTDCPTRIADKLPSGESAELVEAFRTANKKITLCRTTAGSLYYFGEFSDHREPGIAMPAKRTSDGYEATNPPYRYHIHDGLVTIYKSGVRIGQEELKKEASPE